METAAVFPRPPEYIMYEDAQNWIRALHRDRFLALVDEEEPGVRERLRSDVFPLLPKALEAAPKGLLDADEFTLRSRQETTSWFYEAMAAQHPGAAALADSLSAWAGLFNLQVAWIGDTALRTMIAWHQGPSWLDAQEWLVFWPAWRSALSQDEQRFSMEIPGASSCLIPTAAARQDTMDT